MGSTAIMECHFRGYENDNYCYNGGLSEANEETQGMKPKQKKKKKTLTKKGRF